MTQNKYKILLVEDEGNILNFVSALLEANGYQIITATTYGMAKTMYASHIPDLIILDLGLPDKDGSILLNEIRSRDFTPVIVLSARSDEREKVKLLDMGANDYITKPFGSDELLARVRSALRNRRQDIGSGHLPGGKFTAGDLIIDYDARQIFISDREIKLTQTEYNIVAFCTVVFYKNYISVIRNKVCFCRFFYILIVVDNRYITCKFYFFLFICFFIIICIYSVFVICI